MKSNRLKKTGKLKEVESEKNKALSKRDNSYRLKHYVRFLKLLSKSQRRVQIESEIIDLIGIFRHIFERLQTNKPSKNNEDEAKNLFDLLELLFVNNPDYFYERKLETQLRECFHMMLSFSNQKSIRENAIRLFLIWYLILGDEAHDLEHKLFGNLYKHEFFNSTQCFIPEDRKESNSSINDIQAIECVLTVKLILTNIHRDFLRIQWRSQSSNDLRRIRLNKFCLLWSRFREYYLIKIFHNHRSATLPSNVNVCHPEIYLPKIINVHEELKVNLINFLEEGSKDPLDLQHSDRQLFAAMLQSEGVGNMSILNICRLANQMLVVAWITQIIFAPNLFAEKPLLIGDTTISSSSTTTNRTTDDSESGFDSNVQKNFSCSIAINVEEDYLKRQMKIFPDSLKFQEVEEVESNMEEHPSSSDENSSVHLFAKNSQGHSARHRSIKSKQHDRKPSPMLQVTKISDTELEFTNEENLNGDNHQTLRQVELEEKSLSDQFGSSTEFIIKDLESSTQSNRIKRHRSPPLPPQTRPSKSLSSSLNQATSLVTTYAQTYVNGIPLDESRRMKTTQNQKQNNHSIKMEQKIIFLYKEFKARLGFNNDTFMMNSFLYRDGCVSSTSSTSFLSSSTSSSGGMITSNYSTTQSNRNALELLRTIFCRTHRDICEMMYLLQFVLFHQFPMNFPPVRQLATYVLRAFTDTLINGLENRHSNSIIHGQTGQCIVHTNSIRPVFFQNLPGPNEIRMIFNRIENKLKSLSTSTHAIDEQLSRSNDHDNKQVNLGCSLSSLSTSSVSFSQSSSPSCGSRRNRLKLESDAIISFQLSQNCLHIFLCHSMTPFYYQLTNRQENNAIRDIQNLSLTCLNKILRKIWLCNDVYNYALLIIIDTVRHNLLITHPYQLNSHHVISQRTRANELCFCNIKIFNWFYYLQTRLECYDTRLLNPLMELLASLLHWPEVVKKWLEFMDRYNRHYIVRTWGNGELVLLLPTDNKLKRLRSNKSIYNHSNQQQQQQQLENLSVQAPTAKRNRSSTVFNTNSFNNDSTPLVSPTVDSISSGKSFDQQQKSSKEKRHTSRQWNMNHFIQKMNAKSININSNTVQNRLKSKNQKMEDTPESFQQQTSFDDTSIDFSPKCDVSLLKTDSSIVEETNNQSTTLTEKEKLTNVVWIKWNDHQRLSYYTIWKHLLGVMVHKWKKFQPFDVERMFCSERKDVSSSDHFHQPLLSATTEVKLQHRRQTISENNRQTFRQFRTKSLAFINNPINNLLEEEYGSKTNNSERKSSTLSLNNFKLTVMDRFYNSDFSLYSSVVHSISEVVIYLLFTRQNLPYSFMSSDGENVSKFYLKISMTELYEIEIIPDIFDIGNFLCDVGESFAFGQNAENATTLTSMKKKLISHICEKVSSFQSIYSNREIKTASMESSSFYSTIIYTRWTAIHMLMNILRFIPIRDILSHDYIQLINRLSDHNDDIDFHLLHDDNDYDDGCEERRCIYVFGEGANKSEDIIDQAIDVIEKCKEFMMNFYDLFQFIVTVSKSIVPFHLFTNQNNNEERLLMRNGSSLDDLLTLNILLHSFRCPGRLLSKLNMLDELQSITFLNIYKNDESLINCLIKYLYEYMKCSDEFLKIVRDGCATLFKSSNFHFPNYIPNRLEMLLWNYFSFNEQGKSWNEETVSEINIAALDLVDQLHSHHQHQQQQQQQQQQSTIKASQQIIVNSPISHQNTKRELSELINKLRDVNKLLIPQNLFISIDIYEHLMVNSLNNSIRIDNQTILPNLPKPEECYIKDLDGGNIQTLADEVKEEYEERRSADSLNLTRSLNSLSFDTLLAFSGIDQFIRFVQLFISYQTNSSTKTKYLKSDRESFFIEHIDRCQSQLIEGKCRLMNCLVIVAMEELLLIQQSFYYQLSFKSFTVRVQEKLKHFTSIIDSFVNIYHTIFVDDETSTMICCHSLLFLLRQWIDIHRRVQTITVSEQHQQQFSLSSIRSMFGEIQIKEILNLLFRFIITQLLLIIKTSQKHIIFISNQLIDTILFIYRYEHSYLFNEKYLIDITNAIIQIEESTTKNNKPIRFHPFLHYTFYRFFDNTISTIDNEKFMQLISQIDNDDIKPIFHETVSILKRIYENVQNGKLKEIILRKSSLVARRSSNRLMEYLQLSSDETISKRQFISFESNIIFAFFHIIKEKTFQQRTLLLIILANDVKLYSINNEKNNDNLQMFINRWKSKTSKNMDRSIKSDKLLMSEFLNRLFSTILLLYLNQLYNSLSTEWTTHFLTENSVNNMKVLSDEIRRKYSSTIIDNLFESSLKDRSLNIGNLFNLSLPFTNQQSTERQGNIFRSIFNDLVLTPPSSSDHSLVENEKSKISRENFSSLSLTFIDLNTILKQIRLKTNESFQFKNDDERIGENEEEKERIEASTVLPFDIEGDTSAERLMNLLLKHLVAWLNVEKSMEKLDEFINTFLLYSFDLSGNVVRSMSFEVKNTYEKENQLSSIQKREELCRDSLSLRRLLIDDLRLMTNSNHSGWNMIDGSVDATYSNDSWKDFTQKFINYLKRPTKEEHKIACLFVKDFEKNEILKNEKESTDFQFFLYGLGWWVDAMEYDGYIGRYDRRRTDQDEISMNHFIKDVEEFRRILIFEDEMNETAFHISTRMPTLPEYFNKKLSHLGNDDIHIVWCEYPDDLTFKRLSFPTELADVIICIYPMKRTSNLHEYFMNALNEENGTDIELSELEQIMEMVNHPMKENALNLIDCSVDMNRWKMSRNLREAIYELYQYYSPESNYEDSGTVIDENEKQKKLSEDYLKYSEQLYLIKIDIREHVNKRIHRYDREDIVRIFNTSFDRSTNKGLFSLDQLPNELNMNGCISTAKNNILDSTITNRPNQLFDNNNHDRSFVSTSSKNSAYSYVGPLHDGCLVSGRTLAKLVRETATNYSRILRLFKEYPDITTYDPGSSNGGGKPSDIYYSCIFDELQDYTISYEKRYNDFIHLFERYQMKFPFIANNEEFHTDDSSLLQPIMNEKNESVRSHMTTSSRFVAQEEIMTSNDNSQISFKTITTTTTILDE
ncbi:hypothetical protein SNEBB_000616 [Seison nebaliae]|nr:hypothetical protein SNEBB_000616 [Seison nebaliae]